jgi:hypothetical protein
MCSIDKTYFFSALPKIVYIVMFAAEVWMRAKGRVLGFEYARLYGGLNLRTPSRVRMDQMWWHGPCPWVWSHRSIEKTASRAWYLAQFVTRVSGSEKGPEERDEYEWSQAVSTWTLCSCWRKATLVVTPGLAAAVWICAVEEEHVEMRYPGKYPFFGDDHFYSTLHRHIGHYRAHYFKMEGLTREGHIRTAKRLT